MGRARRLRPLVESVLPAWGLHGARIRLLEVATHVVFRIDHSSGRYVMKVDTTDEHPQSDVDIALAWLAALVDSDVDVVRLVPTRDGRNYAAGSVEGVSPNRRCVLYGWVAGKPLFEAPSAALYRELGRVTARLHAHAARWTPPAEPSRWDRVFYYDEPVIIDWRESGLTRRQRAVARAAADAVEPVLEALYERPGARVIHADLHGWNVHQRRGRLTVLDFDDVMWGYPVQDVAITLSYWQGHEDYPEWCDAYEEGYREIAAWPAHNEELVLALRVARRVMFLNSVLLEPERDWSEDIERWCDGFEDYLDG